MLSPYAFSILDNIVGQRLEAKSAKNDELDSVTASSSSASSTIVRFSFLSLSSLSTVCALSTPARNEANSRWTCSERSSERFQMHQIYFYYMDLYGGWSKSACEDSKNHRILTTDCRLVYVCKAYEWPSIPFKMHSLEHLRSVSRNFHRTFPNISRKMFQYRTFAIYTFARLLFTLYEWSSFIITLYEWSSQT